MRTFRAVGKELYFGHTWRALDMNMRISLSSKFLRTLFGMRIAFATAVLAAVPELSANAGFIPEVFH